MKLPQFIKDNPEADHYLIVVDKKLNVVNGVETKNTIYNPDVILSAALSVLKRNSVRFIQFDLHYKQLFKPNKE